MDNLTKDLDEKEIQFIMNCCALNIKASLENISRFSGKTLLSKLDEIMYQNELIHKLQSKIKDKKDGKKKNKLSLTGISTTPPEDITPENLEIISDDELKKRIVNGTLVDDKLETTLFPNGRSDK
tara:strand:- start:202 stop:576 length:375 start_codon:yes stop_codon:yes gene_type:complete